MPLPHRPASDRVLRAALVANAGFSACTGSLLAADPGLVGHLLGIDGRALLRMLGVGLLLFAADLVHQATRPRISALRAWLASSGDLMWVGASVVLLAARSHWFSSAGSVVVALVAVAVLGFGLWQLAGLKRHLAEPNSSLGTQYRHCLQVQLQAPAEPMWQVVADLPGIRRFSPNLAESFLRRGDGLELGAVRACADVRGARWAEQVVGVDADAFCVRFLEDEPGFPFPVRRMLAGWRVQAGEEGGCIVTVWWSFTPKFPVGGLLLAAVMAAKLDVDFPKMIGRMADDANALGEGRPLAPTPSSASAGFRLMPTAC